MKPKKVKSGNIEIRKNTDDGYYDLWDTKYNMFIWDFSEKDLQDLEVCLWKLRGYELLNLPIKLKPKRKINHKRK